MSPVLHGISIGDPSKATLLFLHGFMGSHEEWIPFMKDLAGDFHCLAVDLPGHGQSLVIDDARVFTFAGAAEAVLAFLDAHAVPSAHLVGYSMGGRLALYVARHHAQRCRRITMESASPGLLDAGTAHARATHDDRWARRFDEEPLATVVEAWYRQPLFASLRSRHEVYEAMLARRLRNDPRGLALSMRGMSVGRQQSLWDDLAELRSPVDFIAGALDRKYVAIGEQMGARNPLIQLHRIPHAGHNPHVEEPDAFARVLQRIVKQG